MDNLGWVKLHRKILDSRVFLNKGLLKLWIYCLCRANHKKNWVGISTGRGEAEVKVLPGQFIFGRKTVAEELEMSPSTLYDRMQKLKGMKNINIQSNSHYSIVSICNWETYQQGENEKQQASNRQATQTRMTRMTRMIRMIRKALYRLISSGICMIKRSARRNLRRSGKPYLKLIKKKSWSLYQNINPTSQTVSTGRTL